MAEVLPGPSRDGPGRTYSRRMFHENEVIDGSVSMDLELTAREMLG